MPKGKLQKEELYKPLEAFDDANYARTDAVHAPPEGEVGRLGYLMEPYVDAGPAIGGTFIRNTKPSFGSLGNDGTSRTSYEIQPQLVDADDPEAGGHQGEGTGNSGARNK